MSGLAEIAAIKDARRLKDIANFNAGVPGDVIARRNAWVSPESAWAATLVFVGKGPRARASLTARNKSDTIYTLDIL